MAAWIFCACVPLSLACAEKPAGEEQQPAAPPPATQTTPPPAGQTPAPAATPPRVPIKPREAFYAGDGLSLTLRYEYDTGHPTMHTGRDDANTYPSELDFGGKPRPTPEGILSIPVGKHNALRISFFRTLGTGNSVTTENVTIFGTTYTPGTYLASHYNLENAKLSLDYLSWPFPVKDSKFHIKTLWEVQYTNILSSVDAPLLHGELNAAGAPVLVNATGKDWFLYPSFGLGADYLISKNFRFEARGSGFAIPHHSTLWDTEASLDYRWGALELQVGAKAFHFKTSPNRVEYVGATIPGAFVGLRWYLEHDKH